MSKQKRSGRRARVWVQYDLLPFDPLPGLAPRGVGARQPGAEASRAGGGYLNERNGSKVQDGQARKDFAGIPASGAGGPDQIREAMMLTELDAMGLSSTALQVSARIGFDNFMTLWQLLDMLPETWSENESAILWRLPRLQAWRRYQRNRFVETLATAGWTQPEIRARVKQDLGEDLSDRHMRRLMASARVRA